MKILKFYSNRCTPCKKMNEELKKSSYKTLVQGVDIDRNRGLMHEYKVKKIPTIIFVNEEGKNIFSFSGFKTAKEFDETVKWLNDN